MTYHPIVIMYVSHSYDTQVVFLSTTMYVEMSWHLGMKDMSTQIPQWAMSCTKSSTNFPIPGTKKEALGRHGLNV